MYVNYEGLIVSNIWTKIRYPVKHSQNVFEQIQNNFINEQQHEQVGYKALHWSIANICNKI